MSFPTLIDRGGHVIPEQRGDFRTGGPTLVSNQGNVIQGQGLFNGPLSGRRVHHVQQPTFYQQPAPVFFQQPAPVFVQQQPVFVQQPAPVFVQGPQVAVGGVGGFGRWGGIAALIAGIALFILLLPLALLI